MVQERKKLNLQEQIKLGNSTSSITLMFNDFLRNAKGVVDQFKNTDLLVPVDTNSELDEVFTKVEAALEPEVVLVRGPQEVASRVERVLCNHLQYKPIQVELLTQQIIERKTSIGREIIQLSQEGKIIPS